MTTTNDRAGAGGAAYAGLVVRPAIERSEWQDALPGDVAAFAHETFAACAERLGWPEATVTEVSLTLADDATVREVNATWRGKDKATNILSFPMPAPPVPGPSAGETHPSSLPGPLFGDLLLAFETVEREARGEEKRFVDHFRHLLVHGFLHLAGFDHESDDEAERMEFAEVAILKSFGVADPYQPADTQSQPAGKTDDDA